MLSIAAKSVLCLALLAQAPATTPGPGDKAKAKALLAEGLRFNRQGQYVQALEKFQAAYAAYPSPKLWFNIGQVEVALNRPVEAIEAYERFLALVPEARPENRMDAEAAVAQLGKKLGRVQIRCDTPGAEVVVDGKSVGRAPLPGPLWTMPGSHHVTLTHEGSRPATETVDTSAGATTVVVVRLVPLAPAGPPPAPSLGRPGPEVTPPAVPSVTAAPSAPPTPEPSPVTRPALDLSAAPTPTEATIESRPIYKTWWFWTGAAAVVVAGAATTFVLVARQGGSNVPETPLGNHGVFQ